MRNDHESGAPITRIARNLKELGILSYHIETLLVSMDFKLVLFGLLSPSRKIFTTQELSTRVFIKPIQNYLVYAGTHDCNIF